MLFQIIEENGQKKIQALTADTGTGAPVGSYLYLEKKSNPQGYLYCDGSTFDETVYPALYQYLGTNVLPDWRELGAKGAEKNTTLIFDSTETDPSTGQAGTQNHDVFTQGEFKDDQLQNITGEVGLVGYENQASESGALKTISVGQRNQASSGNVIYLDKYSLTFDASKSARAGAVTRGKSRAVFIYIKATSGLTENQQENVLNTINENNSYSTEEHPTGKKWIDGKPIYRIVTTATKNQQVDTTAYKDTGAPLPSNVDKYILIRSTQNTANAFYYSTTNTTLYIAAVTTMNALSGTNYILEYTKTTD